METTDSKMGDLELIMKICDTLPQTWEATLAALQTQSDMMKDYSKFSSFITNEYLRRREKETTNDRKTAFNATKESRSKFQGNCYNCDKKGHQKKDCWMNGGGQEGKGPRQIRQKKTANTASKENPESKERNEFLLSVTTNGNMKGNVVTIIDSGASDHMFTHRELFVTYEPISEVKVNLADNSSTKAIGKGNIKIIQGSSTVILRNVLHVPNLTKNLISVNRMLQIDDVKVRFEKEECIVELNKKVILKAQLMNGLYEVKKQKTELANTVQVKKGKPLMEWHRTLGHMNCNDVLKLADAVNGMKISDKIQKDCEICIANKSTKYNFKRKTEYPNVKDSELEVGEVISTDVDL